MFLTIQGLGDSTNLVQVLPAEIFTTSVRGVVAHLGAGTLRLLDRTPVSQARPFLLGLNLEALQESQQNAPRRDGSFLPPVMCATLQVCAYGSRMSQSVWVYA
jgi:hypothetical protein